MSFQDKMNAKFDAFREKQQQDIKDLDRKKAQYRIEADQNAQNIKNSAQELKDIGSDIKSSYREARTKLNADIAANHGKKPTDDGMVATAANLGIRIVKLFFAGIFLVAFIYILVNMII